MTRLSYRHSAQRLMFATALPLGLLAAGTISAFAGSITVTGGWGANGSCENPGGAGQPATADEGHLIPNSDPSNTATAQGGHGGQGGNACSGFRPGAGGPGGLATATATTNIKTGSASATANATGGNGGTGGAPRGAFFTHAPGGPGGAATATSSAADAGDGLVTSIATANGGSGGFIGGLSSRDGPGGMATASAVAKSTQQLGAVNVTASATGGPGGAAAGGAASANAAGVAITGNVQASASANGGTSGPTPGTAFAQSDAKNSYGEAVTTASAPGGGVGMSPSALTLAGVGSGNVALASAFTPGQVVANAVLTPGNGAIIGVGAMAAAYGGLGPLQYAANSVFDFTTSNSEALDLMLISDEDAGIGLDSLEVKVAVNGTTQYDNTFSLSSAETFFTNNHLIPLGTFVAEGLSVSITYDLTYNAGTQAVVRNGFGFTYNLIDPPLSVPETSTWVMMLLGFAGIACVGYRASRRPLGPRGWRIAR